MVVEHGKYCVVLLKDFFLTYIHRLLHNDDVKDNFFEKQVIKLFDYQFITENALVEQRQKLFNFLRYVLYQWDLNRCWCLLSFYFAPPNTREMTNNTSWCCIVLDRKFLNLKVKKLTKVFQVTFLSQEVINPAMLLATDSIFDAEY
jgi:hypothetical protein